MSRWFSRRYRLQVNDLIEHPYRAMLAQFIMECESTAPGCQLRVTDVIDAIYEFRSGSQSAASDRQHAPLQLLTAHRAKGLEFDHVLIMDAGGWEITNDEERRLYYVAMTRARKTLTLCARQGSPHGFIRDCEELCLKSQPTPTQPHQALGQRCWMANPKQVVLSWPGYFAADKAIHAAIAELDVGSELILQARSDGKPGWELATVKGITVTRMAQAFSPPAGKISAVKVAAILARHKSPTDTEILRCNFWEVVLPEISYSA
jgi:ATP-dependent DNA helicase RecQ